MSTPLTVGRGALLIAAFVVCNQAGQLLIQRLLPPAGAREPRAALLETPLPADWDADTTRPIPREDFGDLDAPSNGPVPFVGDAPGRGVELAHLMATSDTSDAEVLPRSVGQADAEVVLIAPSQSRVPASPLSGDELTPVPHGSSEDATPPSDPASSIAPPARPEVPFADDDLRAVIRQELPQATPDEIEIWLTELRGLSAEGVRDVLRIRRILKAPVGIESRMPIVGPKGAGELPGSVPRLLLDPRPPGASQVEQAAPPAGASSGNSAGVRAHLLRIRRQLRKLESEVDAALAELKQPARGGRPAQRGLPSPPVIEPSSGETAAEPSAP